MDEEKKQDQEPTNEQEQQPSGTPPSLSDEQWELAFQHPRFKDLAKRAKEAEARLKEREQAERDAAKEELKAKQEFAKLYEQAQDEVVALKAELDDLRAAQIAGAKRQAVALAARKAGLNDRAADDAHLFVRLDDINLADDGSPDMAQVAKLVKALAQERPYLVEKRSDPGTPPGRKPAPGQAGSGQPPVPVPPLTL